MHVSMRDSIRERYYVVLDICVAERAHVCVWFRGTEHGNLDLFFESLINSKLSFFSSKDLQFIRPISL